MTATVATFYQTNLAHSENVEESDTKLKRRLSLLNETNELANKVLNNWESTITESAKKGVGKVNILVYDTSTTEGKRTSFLMRGYLVMLVLVFLLNRELFLYSRGLLILLKAVVSVYIIGILARTRM